jgi:Fe(3+) dicitrate transport protein
MRNLIKAFTSAILALGSLSLSAQSGSVLQGQITQGSTPQGLPGASVFVEGTNLGAATNGQGKYRLSAIPAGEHTLVVSCIGYKPERVQLLLEEGQTLVLNLSLKEAVLDLPEAVVRSLSMTGGAIGLRDVPGSAHYLSPRELQRFQYTDVNRTLRSVPGVNIQEEEGFGLRPNIGLRGTGTERSSKITIMEDGILMAPAPYAAPAAYYFPTMGRMQAVEVLKGSSQIKYGPFTTGGAINFISTQIPDQFTGRVTASAGSFGLRSLHASLGDNHKNIGYVIEAFQHAAEGFKQLDSRGETGFRKTDLLAKLRVQTSPGARFYQSLTFKLGAVDEVSDETYLGLTDADFEANPLRRYAASQVDVMDTRQYQYSATHVVRFSERFSLTSTAYRNDFSRNWYKLDALRDSAGTKVGIASLLDNPQSSPELYAVLGGATSLNPNALEVKANNRVYYAQGLQTLLAGQFQTGAVEHALDAGLRFHQDEMDRFQWVDAYRMEQGLMLLNSAGTPGTESNAVESARAWAAFMQYRMQIGSFSVLPGLRYENILLQRLDYGRDDPARTGADLSERSNTVGVWIPGLAMDYAFSDEFMVFAGVHKGFAPPGSNEGALPENSINYELGSRVSYRAWNATAVAFLNDYSNLLGADLAAGGGGGSTATFNGGSARSSGLELQLSGDLLAGRPRPFALPISLAYTFTRAVFLSDFSSSFDGWGEVGDGDLLPYLAPHQWHVLVALEHSRFQINAALSYVDAMRTQAGQGEIPAGQGTDAYVVLDLSAHYAAFRQATFFVSGNNLTNAAYAVARRPAGLRPGMPRAWLVGVRTNF